MTLSKQEHRNAVAAIFRDKPELIIDLPDWQLSQKQIEIYRNTKHLAMVEIAGRDSVAAAIKSVEEHGFTDLLPVYVYTGTEFGDWAHVEQAVDRLARRLPDVLVHPLLVMGSPKFWRALNGRFISDLISRYGFYSPCPGCHLYLHAIRIPLAKELGNIPVISGERELHAGVSKINQTAEALDFYLDIAAYFDVHLLFPLRYISSGDEVKQILQLPWELGKGQLGCVLSGNYRTVDGQTETSPSDIRRFFDEFAGPFTKQIITSYISGDIPDHDTIAKQLLQCTS